MDKNPGNPSRVNAAKAVADTYRERGGAILAVLTKTFGTANFDLAENSFHEAIAKALKAWPDEGVPENPAAWLIVVAKHSALDGIRRKKLAHDRANAAASHLYGDDSAASPQDLVAFDEELADSELKMMFVCCHPILPLEVQIALTLKTLCGLEVPEIAKAFFTSEDTIAKRLVRARQKLRDERVSFDLPLAEPLVGRLDAVTKVLYLLFTEGHSAHFGPDAMRPDLCREAVRLCSILLGNQATQGPQVYALSALMLLLTARLGARLDGEGNLLTLAEQDRSKWSRPLVERGLKHLAAAAEGKQICAFHLEAGIAACHALSPHFGATDWRQIVAFYDQLLALTASPVVQLNRAIALGFGQGPERGLAELHLLKSDPKLKDYYLLYAAFGEFYLQVQNHDEARASLQKALELAETEPERRFLIRKIHSLA